jgi:hypothetical protein
MKAAPLLFVVLVLMLAGCSSVGTNKKWYSPATWFSDSAAQTVERLETKEDVLIDGVSKSGQIELFKTTVALNSPLFAPEKKIEVASRTANNALNLFEQVSPLTIGEKWEAENVTLGLLADLDDARRSQEQAEKAYREQGEDLAGVREELKGAGERAKDEAARNLALANQLRTERLIKWGAILGNGLLIIGVFFYRNNFLGLADGVARGIGGMQKKFGADDTDLTALKAEIDALASVKTQALLAGKVARML